MGSLLSYQPPPGTSTRDKLRGFGRYATRYAVISVEIVVDSFLNMIQLMHSSLFSVASTTFGYYLLHLIPFRPFRLPTLWSTLECALVGTVTIDLFIVSTCMLYNKLLFGHWMGWKYFPGGDISKKAVREPDIDYSPPKYRTNPLSMFMSPHPTWITVLSFVKFAVLGSLGSVVLSYYRG